MSTQNLSGNRQGELRITNIAIVVLTVIFVGLRIAARFVTRLGLGIDDYLLLVALFFLFAAFGLTLEGIHYGVGRHSATLTIPQLVGFGKTLMAFECLYVIAIALTKCSVLLMYRRIFPVREVRIGSWILGGMSVAWAIAIIMVSIFQCTPIQKTWNPTLPGHCINLKSSFIGNGVPNFLTDIFILVLPVHQVWKLQTSTIQRVQLSIVFLLGSFVVFTSIYRFTTLFQFTQTDPTWTLATAWTWCVVEMAAAIISACLPTLGPFVRSIRVSLGIQSTKAPAISAPSSRSIIHMKTNIVSDMNSDIESGTFEKGNRKPVGSRPFVRLTEDYSTGSLVKEAPLVLGYGAGSNLVNEFGVRDKGDGWGFDSSTDWDEIQLHGIKVKKEFLQTEHTNLQETEQKRQSV